MLIQQRLKRLQEERGRVNKDMESMVETAEKDNKRSLTAEEEKRFDDLSNDFSAKTAEIERLQKLAKAESQRNEEHHEEVEQRNTEKTAEQQKTEYRSAFMSYLAHGVAGMSVEQREILKKGLVEQRALGSGTSGGQTGGYTIPSTLSSELEKALKTTSGMIDVSRYINTASGEPFGWPTTNDTANKARIIGENTSSIPGSTDPTFGQVSIGAYLYTSDFILIPLTLIQDSILNIDSVVAELLAERFGRAFNAHFTTGTGVGQPTGLITALDATNASAGAAKRTIGGAAAAITFDNLIDIQHGPDRAYRNNGQYMFSDDTLKSLRKIKSTDGHYIFQLGNPQTGTPDTIMGKRFTINDDMANVGAGNISAVFGDFNKYIVRQVLTPVIKRTDERFIESYQLGLVGFARMDGNLTQPLAFSALKHAAA